MSRRNKIAILAVLALTSTALADAILIVGPADVSASIHDEPIDGVGDIVDTTITPGRISLSPTAEDRAVQEFDVTAVDTSGISAAYLYGRVNASDTTDVGLRTLEFSVYDANGTAEASDFQIAAAVVGTEQYHPPFDAHVDYFVDASTAIMTLLDAGVTHIGVRIRCASGASPGDELSTLHGEIQIEYCVGWPGSLYCFGDSGNCPGGAIGAPLAGCPHLAGPNGAQGATLFPQGNSTFGNDTFSLYVSSGPSSLGIVIQGDSPIAYPNGNGSVPASAGLFCVAPQLRGYIEFTNRGAQSDEALIDDFQGQPFSATAQPAGLTTYYQFWFRDVGNPNANPGGGAEFNFSNAVEVFWF